MNNFESFPDDARLWVYGFERPLDDEERRRVNERLEAFMAQWHSHNVGVRGDFVILQDRFVILTGASDNGISGCSIDSSVENFKFFRDELGLNALNRNLVHYRDAGGTIRVLDRAAFKSEVVAGSLGPDTIVFDLTIPTLGDLRAGRFETRMAESWHAKAFLPT